MSGPGVYRTRLLKERDPALGYWRSLFMLLDNVAEWWTPSMYDRGVYKVDIGKNTFYHLGRPEHFKAVLLDNSHAFSRSFISQALLSPAMGRGLLTSDGEFWKAQRRTVAPLFRQATLDQFLPPMDAAANRAVEVLAKDAGQIQEVLPHMVDTTLEVILNTIFGGADLDREQVARDVDIYLDKIGSFDLLDAFKVPSWVPRPWKWKGYAAVRRLRRMSKQSLTEQPDDNELLSRLVASVDPETGESMSEELIIDNLMTFTGAGHETTAVGLAWALYLLAEQPELQEKLANEASTVLPDETPTMEAIEALDLNRRFFQETMRLYPPIAAVVRSVIAPVEFGNFKMKAGDHITLAILPMHRNPAFWPDPDRFDPDRFLPEKEKERPRFAYAPFGGGPRICVAWQFALMEATLVLARLVKAYRFKPTGQTPRPKVSVSLRPENGVPLIWEPRV